MAQMIQIGKAPSIYTNLVAYDYQYKTSGVSFFSGFCLGSHVDNVKKELGQKGKRIVFRDYRTHTERADSYEVITSKFSGSDYTHIVAYKKDYIETVNENEIINAFLFIRTIGKENGSQIRISNYTVSLLRNPESTIPDALVDAVYDKLYQLSPLPILKDWVPYLIRSMIVRSEFYALDLYASCKENEISALVFSIPVLQLRELITKGLESGIIRVSETHPDVSDAMRNLSGLDAYLAHFRETLTKRIQDSFQPRFIPGENAYSQTLEDVTDYGSYVGRLGLFDAQKSVVQAVSNALDHKKTAFIIGEPGVGKTATAIAAALTHNNDSKAMTNIVMCPGHLVEKWRKEILRIAPNSDAVIVSDFDTLTSLMPTIKDKERRRHLWMVISKEVAKFGYQERPAVIWSRAKGMTTENQKHPEGVYCCPSCGEPLYTERTETFGGGRRKVKLVIKDYFGYDAFSHKTAENSRCRCGAKLWEAVGRDGNPDEERWVNLGANCGWIEKQHIQAAFDHIANNSSASKMDTKKLPALSKALAGEIPPQKAPIKYPIGKYIRRYLKGYIDYALIDEVHTLKAKDSLQGQAFGDLVCAAKHSLCFTGTLLNGYASGIFYLLYRTFPALMKKEGFEYGFAGEQKFTRKYGVFRKSTIFSYQMNTPGARLSGSEKALPGVSPVVFTKFLLENAAFISLEDIGTGLPGYEEIPVPIDMDAQTQAGYVALETATQNYMRATRTVRGLGHVMTQLLQGLSIYPDQPYNQPPIVDMESGELVCTPMEFDSDTLRPKEEELIRLVKEKVKEGQKVLVYYSWTNRTELSEKLPKLLQGEGIKTAVMTASVTNRDREAWIETQVKKKDIDVLICNPSLVGTGLDLLDFTTIIYYQIGYNLFTLRQSSRRSWRLSQDKDVKVYFMYYRNTGQEQALSLMATKLQAAMAIEGKFSEDGLNAMSNNEDILTQLAASVADGIKNTVDVQVFSRDKKENTKEKICVESKKRMIDIPQRFNVVSLMDKLMERRKKPGGRTIPLRACGTEEKEVLRRPYQFFAAV